MNFENANKWLVEALSKHLLVINNVKDIYYNGKSEYQKIDVLETGWFGRTLVLDNKIQSAEVDERIYHESLVHPVMLAHPNPKTVFVGGGGEGATVREVLRHKSVEKVVMVDIDKTAVEVCMKYLKQHHDGAFENPKLELIFDDAKKRLEESPINFDVIILDLADPTEGGPCYLLYTKSFYKMVLSKLNPGGLIVTQAGPAGFLTCNEVMAPVHRTFQEVFGKDRVHPYIVHIPSFTDNYAFCIGRSESADDVTNIAKTSDSEIDERIANRVSGQLEVFDGETARHMFAIPKHIRTKLNAETRVITEDSPAFIFTS